MKDQSEQDGIAVAVASLDLGTLAWGLKRYGRRFWAIGGSRERDDWYFAQREASNWNARFDAAEAPKGTA